MRRYRFACSVGFLCLATLSNRVWADGGDNCDVPTVVGSLPFSDVGNTCAPGIGNAYDELCPNASSSPDVVYTYIEPFGQCVNVGLCGPGTSFDTKLYVYEGVCPPSGGGPSGLQIACDDDDACAPGNLASAIDNLVLGAGAQYWFVVDGSSDECGDYQIDIVPCQPQSCDTDQDCCDGIFCNGEEVCVKGECQPGTPPSCDDGDPCTGDFCDQEDDTCVNSPAPGCCFTDADCNDGNDCTDEVCNIDPCTPGTPGTCEHPFLPAGTPCGNQSDTACDNPNTCDEAGVCQDNLEQDDTPCDDGLFCTEGESCTGGVCGGGTPYDCDDGDPCTTDECDDGDDSCVNTPIEQGCCLTNEECDDGNECTDNICNPENQCEYPLTPGVPCGSQSSTECTAPDTCDQDGVCQSNHTNEGGPCDDNNTCTDNDACVNGVCTGTPSGVCETCQQAGPGDEPPNQISFQAKLKNADGTPILDPTVNLEFVFYDIGGVPVGSPVTVNNVQCIDWGDGHCGVSTQIPIEETLFGDAVQLGVSVNGGDELQPLLPVTSAARAFRVGCADSEAVTDVLKLGGADTFGELRIVGPDPNPAASRVDPVWDYATIQTKSTSEGDCGQALLMDDAGTTVDLSACDVFGNLPLGGTLRLKNAGFFNDTIELQAGSDIVSPQVTLRDFLGNDRIILTSGSISIKNSSQQNRARLSGEVRGILSLYQSNGDLGVYLSADTSGYGQIRVRNSSNEDAVVVDGGHHDGGRILLKNNDGDTRLALEGGHSGPRAGKIRVFNGAGDETIVINGDFNGDGRVITQELQITGGSDLSEQFDIGGPTEQVKPGMVVSIDPERPGKLMISTEAYDTRVAGVISGAGGVEPGMLMGQSGSEADGDHPVALTGRVYCWADASNGPIQPGDLLTTSDTPGHAMRVTDHGKAHGAIIGKAMSSLKEGKDLVLVLVQPQ